MVRSDVSQKATDGQIRLYYGNRLCDLSLNLINQNVLMAQLLAHSFANAFQGGDPFFNAIESFVLFRFRDFPLLYPSQTLQWRDRQSARYIKQPSLRLEA